MNLTNNEINLKLFSANSSGVIVNRITDAESFGEYAFGIRKPYDDDKGIYYWELAECMTNIGANRLALKCEIKALLCDYTSSGYDSYIPISSFKKMYIKLLELGYDDYAERLIKYHMRKVEDASYFEHRTFFKDTPVDKWVKANNLLTKNGYYRDELIFSDDYDNLSFELNPYQADNGKWGYNDGHGVSIIDTIYDEVTPFNVSDSFYSAVKLGGKWGVINRTGYSVVEPKYDTMSANSQTHFDITLRGCKGKLDLYGNEYWCVTLKMESSSQSENSYNVDAKLKNYLDEYIISKYRNCYCYPHGNYVKGLVGLAMSSTLKLDEKYFGTPMIKDICVSKDLLYTAVAFHNISATLIDKNNYLRSAQIMRDDYYIRTILDDDQIELIAEAIESLAYPDKVEYNSSYSKILHDLVYRLGC
ncbi:MAG: WG repeat-containing protein [Bacteroidales bacterium]